MRLGIGSWTYGWAVGIAGCPHPARPLTCMDLIERARSFGLDAVQFADNLPVHKLPPAEAKQLRDEAARSRIAIELGTVGVEPDHLRLYLQLAVLLGARLVRTLIGTPLGAVDLVDAEACIRCVANEFRLADVVLAIENYEGMSSEDLAAFVKRLANPYVGICLDTANSLGAMELPRQVVTNLAPYARNLHVKDFTLRRLPYKMGFEIVGCPVGEGRLDIDWIIGKLRKCNRDPTLLLEQWTPWSGTIEQTITVEEEWAERSLRFLERYR